MGVGCLLSHEWCMYILDALLMWSFQAILLVWLPEELQSRQGDGSEDGHVIVGASCQ